MRSWLAIVIALVITIPGVLLRLGAFGADAPTSALLYGISIVGAAFLLSWAAEAVQIDISQGWHLPCWR